ncbi:MAG: hypothetical protein ACK2UA_02975 [Anaerolineae bacterium]
MIQRWKKLGGPIQIGLVLGLIGALLTVIGILMGNLAPPTARSIILGIVLGGGSWGVVSWAIAAVAADTADESDTQSASEEEE